ncbi:MAG: response regulator, partial [Muribaculaceae bacterium]|nr:response regulator [Muribaculaceae bacterium]
MKCIIVDDVPMACKGMRRLVEGRRELELIGMYENAEDALAVLETGDVDLMFLDIQMAGMNGMELARKAGKGVMVVFTTAYSEYAVDS